MSYRTEIELEAGDLGLDESKYTDCVACGKKGKFGITRTGDGNLLYHCFSSSCTLHRGGVVGSFGVRQQQRPPVRRPQFTEPVTALDNAGRAHLQEVWGFYEEHFLRSKVKWCPAKGRYAFPIQSPLGDTKGWVLRSMVQAPKALTYLEDDDDVTRLSWYIPEVKTNWTLVVEDIPSAVRASMYINAVALLGTSCNYDAAREIASVSDNVIWCLDDDAFIQGLRLKTEHNLLFDRSDVLRPPKDLKNMAELELKKFLENYGVGA